MKKVICIWKPVGFTPLQAIFKFKKKNPEYKQDNISYAGRLDPMAEGILVLLVGDENKNRDKYLGLDKEYETEIVFGVSTDTFDSLGLITKINIKEVSKNEIEKTLVKHKGKQKQTYPPFSSKTVDGKPLYWWSREKKLNEIQIPVREIDVYTIKLLDFENVSVQNLVNKITGDITKVGGDFRQQEIIERWRKFEKENKNLELVKTKLKISCSSGTYIRRFADDFGRELGTSAFAYSISRTKVGKYSELDCEKIST